MSDSPVQSDARQTLRQILAEYGPDVRLDPRRCEALLRDLCPGGKRDVTLLLTALRERIPDDLLAAPPGQPAPVLVARLAKRLVDSLGLADDAARWAVASWAIALGLAGEDDLPAPAPAPPAYVPPPPPPPAPPRAPLPPDWQRPQPPVPPARPSEIMLVGRWFLAAFLIIVIGLMLIPLIADSFGSRHAEALPPQPSQAPPAAQAPKPPADPAGVPIRRWALPKPASVIALSPEGKTVATGGFKLITLWDAATGTKLRDILLTPPPQPLLPKYAMEDNGFKTGEVERLRFSPDGRRLASSAYGVVTVWDAQTGHKERTLEMPMTTEWDTDMGVSTYKQVALANRRVLAFSPDGRTLVADADWGKLLAWDVNTGKRRSLVADSLTSVLAISPDGKTLAGGGLDGVVHLRDAATGRERHTIRVPSTSAVEDPYGHVRYFKDLSAVAFSPDGKNLATNHFGDPHVHLWDAHTGAKGRVIPIADSPVDGLALRPGGAFVCSQRDGLTLQDAKGDVLHRYASASGGAGTGYSGLPQRAFALSGDGYTLAAAGDTVLLWELTGK